ncbi:MAG: hypothetical protein BGO01_00315 [Armatimonadetes bacterium 55-13]|nr:excisionase family DNA-binding protein [Armatimonadota bacterium]ODU52060.1 MAG: hypothetical protein ABT09_03065 [bacterium SCN 57-13]OJU63144.1 MAG: hypothetical protein BGO01_00315 [Armatimonadetes bacterium 55-13]
MAKELERVNAGQVPSDELEVLREILLDSESPKLVGREGFEMVLPDRIFHLLLHVVERMRKGQSVVVMSETETFTTQAAADYLGVSRPFLVKLLEENKIPHFHAGSHRKVRLTDLVDYANRITKGRKAALDELAARVDEAGLYEQMPND